MSRKIEPKASVTITEEEAQLRNTAQGKLLFTSYQNQNCALLIQNDRLMEAAFFPRVPSKIGAIYIGKVKSIIKNINACFVEIEKGELCFLSLKETSAVCLLNRSSDGRILEGDEILVQVDRDAQKSKRSSVTTRLSLSNDYFVLSMGTEKVCYSTKLGKKKKGDLSRLLQEAGILHPQKADFLVQDYGAWLSGDTLRQLKKEGLRLDTFCLPSTGMIVRTKAGELESVEELLSHLDELAWQYIRLLYIAKYRSCFTCLRRAGAPVETVLRQFLGSASGKGGESEEAESDRLTDISSGLCSNASWEIITDQETTYEQLKQYNDENSLGIHIRLYQDSALSLSVLYSVERKLRAALDSKVWLKSGGYLIIEPTEALTVIDVNSGKYESGKNPQETYRKINLEAAEEVALQLRLRNLSGIIIVDFINMQSAGDNAQLLHVLKSLVKQDKIKTTVIDMTPLGLVEITRKKINKPLREQFMGSIVKEAD